MIWITISWSFSVYCTGNQSYVQLGKRTKEDENWVTLDLHYSNEFWKFQNSMHRLAALDLLSGALSEQRQICYFTAVAAESSF